MLRARTASSTPARAPMDAFTSATGRRVHDHENSTKVTKLNGSLLLHNLVLRTTERNSAGRAKLSKNHLDWSMLRDKINVIFSHRLETHSFVSIGRSRIALGVRQRFQNYIVECPTFSVIKSHITDSFELRQIKSLG